MSSVVSIAATAGIAYNSCRNRPRPSPGQAIVPSATGRRCRPGFLLPVRVLSRLFRRLFLTRLADAHAAGRLVLFRELEGLRGREAFAAHLAPLKKKKWFVYAKSPFAGPEAVLAYLTRYTHRVAIQTAAWPASTSAA